jgi:hypothetical protein
MIQFSRRPFATDDPLDNAEQDFECAVSSRERAEKAERERIILAVIWRAIDPVAAARPNAPTVKSIIATIISMRVSPCRRAFRILDPSGSGSSSAHRKTSCAFGLFQREALNSLFYISRIGRIRDVTTSLSF